MVTPAITYLTDEDIVRERDDALRAIGKSLEVLRWQASEFLLDPEEQAVWRRVEDLEYLRGNEAE